MLVNESNKAPWLWGKWIDLLQSYLYTYLGLFPQTITVTLGCNARRNQIMSRSSASLHKARPCLISVLALCILSLRHAISITCVLMSLQMEKEAFAGYLQYIEALPNPNHLILKLINQSCLNLTSSQCFCAKPCRDLEYYTGIPL